LIAQHGKAVDVFLALVVFDAGYRRLEASHVRLERDGKALAKTALRTVADDAEKPGSSGGYSQPDRSRENLTAFCSQNTVCQEAEP
jgi:hypothetical protein